MSLMVANARLFHIRYRNVVDITYISGKASATVASQLELEDCSSLCIIHIPALSRAVLRAEMALPPNQHVIYMFSLLMSTLSPQTQGDMLASPI